MNAMKMEAATDWQGAGMRERRAAVSWKTLVWAMIFPRRRQRISLTVPGLFLMALAIAIGTAAYNTGSNILFITLSLLLACLLLSGLLSWCNFMGVRWRMRPSGPWRAGHETLVTVELENRKKWLPTYSLWFELATQPSRIPEPEKPAKEMKMREILAAAEKYITRGKIFLRERIDPRGSATLEWGVRPGQRGEAIVELGAVGSLFPFGFLRKNIGTGLKHTVTVWPAQIVYQWSGVSAAHSGSQGQRTARAGMGEDLLSLRKYSLGDSHRQIHWKASARVGKLLVRQFAAESHDGYVLRLETPASVWARAPQFELLCSFAATMAEDLFASGRLRGLTINGGPLLETRRMRDLEAVLDELALVQLLKAGPDSSFRESELAPNAGAGAVVRIRAPHNSITFAPDGARGVTAYIDGKQTAAA